MLHFIGKQKIRRAVETVKAHIPFPSTLGRICPQFCERACHRRQSEEEAVSICALKRYVGDRDLGTNAPYVPPRGKPSGKKVAIVGAGPCGLSSAYYLGVVYLESSTAWWGLRDGLIFVWRGGW